MQWILDSLRVSQWAADADGNSHVVDQQTRPSGAAYVFRFACHGGRAAVSSGAAAAPGP